MNAPTARQAARMAYFSAAANALAALSMVTVLRPGLPEPGSIIGDRMAYVASHPAAWQSGWVCCHIAALSLVGLYVCLALRWQQRQPLATTLALICAGAVL